MIFACIANAFLTHFVGSLDEETKQAFVGEVERVAGDPVSWVRTEASFALGALAKVVPVEVIHCSLVSRAVCCSNRALTRQSFPCLSNYAVILHGAFATRRFLHYQQYCRVYSPTKGESWH